MDANRSCFDRSNGRKEKVKGRHAFRFNEHWVSAIVDIICGWMWAIELLLTAVFLVVGDGGASEGRLLVCVGKHLVVIRPTRTVSMKDARSSPFVAAWY